MILFLLFSLPLFFFFIIFLPWGTSKVPDPALLVSTFLKGLLLFFPAYLVILIVRKIFGFSFFGAGLFFSLLLRDELVPLLAAVGSFILMRRKLDLQILEEGLFLGVFAFLSGFLSMMNLADMIRTWGLWDAYVLFLLPFQRIAAVLTIALAAKRYYPWEGREAALFCAVAGVAAVVLSISGFLFLNSRPWWAIILTALPVAATFIAFAMRFPRTLRA